MFRVFALGLMVGLALVVVGCGSKSGKMDVTGNVTLDGSPLAEGDIMFIPSDTKLAREAGKIKNGTYSVKVPSGKSAVEIRAVREVPGKKGPMGTEAVYESIIPTKYNEKTTLSADVGPGNLKFDFPLTSK